MKAVRYGTLAMLFALMSTVAMAQGVFTSLATGNWNAAGSWTLSSGSDGDGIPDADDDVTIGSSHTITVDANSACNNLTLQGVSTGTRLSIGTNVLEVNGTLNGDGTTLSTTLITTGSTGWLRFVGSSRTLIGTNWAGSPNDWGVEVALTSGQTGTATTAIKAKRIRIASGTLSTSNEIRPDSVNVASSGILLIESNAFLSCTRASRTGTVNTPFASFRINGTGKATFSASSAFPSTGTTLTFASGSTIEYNFSSSTAIVDVNYGGNVSMIGTGGKTLTTAGARTITGNLDISAGTFTLTATSTNTLTVNGSVTVSGTTGKLLMSGGDLIILGNLTVSSTGTTASPSLYFSSTAARVMGGASSTGTGTFAVQTGSVVRSIYSATSSTASTQAPISTQFPYWQTLDLQAGSTW